MAKAGIQKQEADTKADKVDVEEGKLQLDAFVAGVETERANLEVPKEKETS